MLGLVLLPQQRRCHLVVPLSQLLAHPGPIWQWTLYGPWRGPPFARARVQTPLEFSLVKFRNGFPGAQTGGRSATQAIRHGRLPAAHGTSQLDGCLPHPTGAASAILDRSHVQPFLRHLAAPSKGLRRVAAGGHRRHSGACRTPRRPWPTAFRSTAKVSAITAESCPPWAGARMQSFVFDLAFAHVWSRLVPYVLVCRLITLSLCCLASIRRHFQPGKCGISMPGGIFRPILLLFPDMEIQSCQ